MDVTKLTAAPQIRLRFEGHHSLDASRCNSAFSTNNAKFLPAPRVAVAWSPFASKKAVIRAGIRPLLRGLDNLSYRLDQNAPFNSVSR